MSAQCVHFPQSDMMHDWQILHDTLGCFSAFIFNFNVDVASECDFDGEGRFRRIAAIGDMPPESGIPGLERRRKFAIKNYFKSQEDYLSHYLITFFDFFQK